MRDAEFLVKNALTITVVDHHRSGKIVHEKLAALSASHKSLYYCKYSEKLSAAQLAWDWANGDVPRPPIIDYVGDRDLFTFSLPNSRAINKVLHVENFTRGFGKLLDYIAVEGGKPVPSMVQRGVLYLKESDLITTQLASLARAATVSTLLAGETTPREYSVLVANVPINRSDVGDAIMEGNAGDPLCNHVVIQFR